MNSRTQPWRLLTLCGVLVIVTACSASSRGRTPEQVAADGAAQVERHRSDPLAEALEIDGLAVLGEPSIVAAFANNDRGEIFGDVGYTPTRFRWAYELEAGADVQAVLDEAVAELELRGAELSRSLGQSRTLTAQSLGDRLTIELLVMEARTTQIAHTITVR